jgi:hypothetical protein
MQTFVRRFLPVFAATLLFAAGARAERILEVNEPGLGPRVFDQPSVAVNGNTIHVAFVGSRTVAADNTVDTDGTQLYYAAVNGAADFTSSATTRAQVIVTPAVAIDNGPYTRARHPQIALRSGSQVVILFHAIPTGGTENKLFRALISLDNNAVTAQRVDEILDPSGLFMRNPVTDPSFGLVTADNTARIAYVDNTAEPDGTVHVRYARVGLDNALLVGTPILLTGQAGSRGVRPLPRLRLDGLNRSHIAWAANNITGAASGIYYALVKQGTTGLDNLAIGATQVLPGGYRWGFPNLLVLANSKILVLAADEPSGPFDERGLAGSLGVSVLNPDGVVQNGLPVSFLNVGANTSFFLSPPGQSVLGANFDAYRPEAAFDGSNRVYVAGYGSLSGESGTPGRFYSMTVSGVTTGAGTIAQFAEMASVPLPVGTDVLAFAGTIPGDYTRPAFARFSGKSVLFWSGPAEVLSGGRNLYVTTVSSVADPLAPTTQSGCSAVDDPRRGESGRIPGIAVLFLPAALLALRKVTRKAVAR